MANNISLFKQYIPLLDEVYKNASLTADLDGAAELARAGANVNELIIPMRTISLSTILKGLQTEHSFWS